MRDYERVDHLEKEVAFLQEVLLNHMKRLEETLEQAIELLERYDDLFRKIQSPD
jgi:hypothetical protein